MPAQNKIGKGTDIWWLQHSWCQNWELLCCRNWIASPWPIESIAFIWATFLVCNLTTHIFSFMLLGLNTLNMTVKGAPALHLSLWKCTVALPNIYVISGFMYSQKGLRWLFLKRERGPIVVYEKGLTTDGGFACRATLMCSYKRLFAGHYGHIIIFFESATTMLFNANQIHTCSGLPLCSRWNAFKQGVVKVFYFSPSCKFLLRRSFVALTSWCCVILTAFP